MPASFSGRPCATHRWLTDHRGRHVIANNTTADHAPAAVDGIAYPDAVLVRLHGHAVAHVLDSDAVIIDTCGYWSATTFDRIHGLAYRNAGWGAGRHRFEPVLYAPTTLDGDGGLVGSTRLPWDGRAVLLRRDDPTPHPLDNPNAWRELIGLPADYCTTPHPVTIP